MVAPGRTLVDGLATACPQPAIDRAEPRRIFCGMKRGLAGVALLAAITAAVSGCGGSRGLPAQLVTAIRSGNNAGVSSRTVDVYGPASRSALVQATGSSVPKVAAEQSGFYLIVFRGHFRAGSSAGPLPAGTKPRHYKILTNIWSAKEGFTDYGVGDHLPDASGLGRPIVVTLKR